MEKILFYANDPVEWQVKRKILLATEVVLQIITQAEATRIRVDQPFQTMMMEAIIPRILLQPVQLIIIPVGAIRPAVL